jgi:DNA-binding transcriptional LysR family regulator
MELRHLRYFLAVANSLSFSRAAAQLHLTQPALSRQVRDLEDELGATLLFRHKTRTALTPVGVQFAEKAREIIAAADRAVEEVRVIGKQLRLGHYGSVWLDHFAPALRKFNRLFPDIQLVPIEMSPVELGPAVRRGEVDFALLGPDEAFRDSALILRRVAEVPALIALSSEHPIGKKRRIALRDLRAVTWLAWDERLFPGRNVLLTQAAKSCGFAPRWGSLVDSIASVFVQVAQSESVCLVLSLAKKLPHAGVVFAELRDPPLKYPMIVAWRKDHRHGKPLLRFAQILAEGGTADSR